MGDDELAVAISAKMREAQAAGDRLAYVCWLNALARLPEDESAAIQDSGESVNS